MTVSSGRGHPPFVWMNPAASPSAAIIDAGGEGQPNAQQQRLDFAEVYDRGLPFVWRSIRRLGVPPESVADAVQDVFVVVHRRLASFDGTSALETWLFGIALRVARDYRRAQQRKPVDRLGDDTLSQIASEQPGPGEHAESMEAVQLLYCILEQLNEKHRAVFVLAELEQMTAPEIARALGEHTNTVYSRLRTARSKFEQALTRHRAKQGRRQR